MRAPIASSRDFLSRERGFSLVEALVALVVLSIGMLGIAALYVESLRAGRTALLRTQAVILATDMSERIRTNRMGRAWYGVAVTSANVSAACQTGGAGCPPAALAQHDKAVWLGALQQALPSGAGTVTWNPATNPEIYTITVSWVETGQAAPANYVLRIQV